MTLNKILRKAKSPSQKRNPYIYTKRGSYTKRGKDNREWKEVRKARIRYLKEDLRREIEAHIREHGIKEIEDTDERGG